MKKSIATKIAALGAIGIMTLAGASTAFASDYGTDVCDITSQKVTESQAHIIMNEAEKEATGEILNKTNDSLTIQDGNYVYEYSFVKTEEEKVYDGTYKTYDEAIHRMYEMQNSGLMYHDMDLDDISGKEDRFNTLVITATIYKGNLQTVCTNIDNSKHIDIDNDDAELHPGDGIELTYSVSEGINMDDVVFESTNPDAVSVVKERGHVYATAHDTGSAMIIATVKNADNTETTGCIHIHVLK